MTLLLPNSTLCNHRVGAICLHMQSYHCHRGMLCISVRPHLQKANSNSSLARAIVKDFASVHSMEPGHKQQGSGSSNIAAQHVFQWSRTSDDCVSTSSSGVNDFERQLQELFDEIKNMIAKGNKKDALDLLRANYEVVKAQMDAGARGIEEAAILDILSLGYMALGDFELVASLLNMLHKVITGLKDEQPLLDSILVHMGSMYSTLGKFEKSMRMYLRVLGILEKTYGTNSTYLITPLLGMAKVSVLTNKAKEAMEKYNRAIIILESSRGTESEDLVVPLSGLGNLLIKEGRASDAEYPFRRILEIYSKSYGQNDGRTGIAMCSLAHAKCAKGEVDEAIRLYRSALQIIKDSNFMALDDEVVEKMRVDLAELLHVVGRGQEGRELLEECLLIVEKHKGTEHPSSVMHLLNLAMSYSRSKDFVDAECLLRRCLQVMMKSVDPNDQSVTFPMLHLAVTLYHIKQDKEAEDLALKVLHIREKAFGKDSLPVGEALDCLVPIQMRLGRDHSELLELLQRVLKIQEKEFGRESEEVIATLKKIVFCLDKMGRKQEKFPLQKRLSMLRKKYKQMVQY